MRNSYSSPLDPIYPDQGKIFFGSRAIIDACKPYDWIRDFPQGRAVQPGGKTAGDRQVAGDI